MRFAAMVVAAAMVLAACGDDSETVSPGTEAPSGTEGPGTSDAIVPITVQQLVERSSDTAVQVAGSLFVVDGAARLCGAIMESYPPQCGNPAVDLTDLDTSAVNLQTEGAVSWSESTVLEVQRNDDGTFRVLNILAS